jgi:CubicO group peptidase (beta-lactamase class C family)
VSNGYPDPQTYKIFPQRPVGTASPVSPLGRTDTTLFPASMTFQTLSGPRTASLPDLFEETQTEAFILIRDNNVIYEKYRNVSARDSAQYSFSVSKSIVSTLIGIAIDDGAIRSVNDQVIQYIPELRDRGLDALTIRDMLMMSTGIPYRRIEDTFFLAKPFSSDITTFYGDHLRETVLGLHAGGDPIGKFFNYNDYYPLVEGMILERAYGMSVSELTQHKLWEPMGMESNASWSIDQADSGFERTPVGFSARAIDFARFGLLFLHHGTWNGRRIVSEEWVNAATAPDPEDKREWLVDQRWPAIGGYYKYHWWGMKNGDGTFDYFASGNLGQIIYVSPSRNAVAVRFGREPDHSYRWAFIVRAFLDQIH